MKIYNSQTRRKEEFVPIEPGKVRIYSCGPTVYNYFHIGNARPFIMFDTLRRYLEHRGYEVTFVQNFTDIDDKMIRRANEEGITVEELARPVHRRVLQGRRSAGRAIARPCIRAPREHIGEIIALIQTAGEEGPCL